MMTPARRWLPALLVLCVLLMLAGGVQAGSGLYLLLKSNNDVASGALILAGLWALLTGTLAAALCGVGPRCLWRRSQLQLLLLCTATAVSTAAAVVATLVPTAAASESPLLLTVRWLALAAVLTAGVVGFVASNVAVGMQLVLPAYGPTTPDFASPKSGISDAYNVRSATMEMQQKSSDLQLSPAAGAPLTAWVYRSQSSTSTAPHETRLDRPPQPPPGDLSGFTAAPPDDLNEDQSSCSGSSFKIHSATTNVQLCATAVPTPNSASSCPSSTRPVPRCVSLLGNVYSGRDRRNPWPPFGRQARSTSLLEVMGPTVTSAAVARVSNRPASVDCLQTRRSQTMLEDHASESIVVSHAAIHEEQDDLSPSDRLLSFPPRPVALDSSPVYTPLPHERVAFAGGQHPLKDTVSGQLSPVDTTSDQHPLTDTIGRLTTALSRLRSEPDYCASRELQEALEALQRLEISPEQSCFTSTRHPPAHEVIRPDSSASNASSSGYGSPEDAARECRPQKEGVAACGPIREEDAPPHPSDTGVGQKNLISTFHVERREKKEQGSFEKGAERHVTDCRDNLVGKRALTESEESEICMDSDPQRARAAPGSRGAAGQGGDGCYRRRSVVQLVTMLESTQSVPARWRRPSEPPPPPPQFVPPPPPSALQAAASLPADRSASAQRRPALSEGGFKQPRSRVLLESEC